MTEIQFTSDLGVQLINSTGSDNLFAAAARVSTQGEASLNSLEVDPSEVKGLINFLMKNRHSSPFEHGQMTFLVHAPIFVFRELMRHRIASYNEESGRYKELAPVFYIPPKHRPLVQVGKAGAYEFVDGDKDQHNHVTSQIRWVSRESYESYQELLEAGVAREVARMVLPLNIMSSAYVTMNPRALMNFLSLRTKSEDSTYPSFPQWEIQQVADRFEALYAEQYPITHAAFRQNGGVAP